MERLFRTDVEQEKCVVEVRTQQTRVVQVKLLASRSELKLMFSKGILYMHYRLSNHGYKDRTLEE